MPINLIPAKKSDAKTIYEWMTSSDLTPQMMGEPFFPEHPVPSYETFLETYLPFFSQKQKKGENENGRCFIITQQDRTAGHIHYNIFDAQTQTVKLCLWMADSSYTGQGIGPAAITMLCSYLKEMRFRKSIIALSARNKNAIKAYKKAGFIMQPPPDDFLPQYTDSIFMEKLL